MAGMPYVPAITALPLLAILAITGCGSSASGTADARIACTEIACAPTLKVHFARPAWPAGAYRIEVTADGASDVCEVNVPLACNVASSCTGLGGLDVSPEVSGCALDPGLHTILGLAFTYSVPASVTVRVVQDERELGKGSFSPSYVTAQPNGPDCPPVCHTATTETLTLAP
jgi:hypothetical protein